MNNHIRCKIKIVTIIPYVYAVKGVLDSFTAFYVIISQKVMLQKSRVLVTGGAGFLGSHLCQRLLAQGHRVICLDNLYTGSLTLLKSCQNNPNFSFIKQDVCAPMSFEIDAIYHLACPASPLHYQRDPLFTIQTSILGSLRVLNLAKEDRIPVLFASTSEVYGDPMVHPQPETYWGNVNPIGLRACYDESKRCAETLFMDHHRQHQVDIRIARIFNTYGPNMSINDGRVISNFIVQALKNEPLTIYGSGTQSRSFCYVDDTITGLIQLLEKPYHSPVNLGHPEEKTILEIAQTIIRLTQSQSTINYLPEVIDDPKQRCPDIRLAQTEFNWEPKIDLITGLEKTIHYFKQLTA